MELDRYGRALVQRWYVVVLLLGVGLLGTWVYFRFTGLASAIATVAVQEPSAAKSLSGGEQAQVNFASIAESLTVSQRVVDQLHLGVDADALRSHVSVKLARTLVPSVAMPLYTVQVQDRDPDQAVLLANTVVKQSTAVFQELNALDQTQVDQALKDEEDRLRQAADQARADFQTFEESNRAWRLDTQIQAQVGLVTNLRQAAQSGSAAATTSHEDIANAFASEQDQLTRLRALQSDYDRLTFDVSVAAAEVSQLAARETDLSALDRAQQQPGLNAVRAESASGRIRLDSARTALADFQRTNGVNDLNAEIAAHIGQVNDLQRQDMLTATPPPSAQDLVAPEQTELDRLYGLVPEYERLSARVSSAESNVAGLEIHKLELVIGSILPATAQVKALAAARIHPDLFFTIILYALGALLGIATGLAVVYLMAYFDRTPYDLADVQAMYPTPVLVLRVPSAY